jgi:hypothetical protein
MRGLARSSAEVVQACFAPRVWVSNFWFGFALRGLALRHVCAIAPRFVPGWRAFSSFSLRQDVSVQKTEGKARQPETKLGATSRTRHKARLRNAKRNRTKNPKPPHGVSRRTLRHIHIYREHSVNTVKERERGQRALGKLVLVHKRAAHTVHSALLHSLGRQSAIGANPTNRQDKSVIVGVNSKHAHMVCTLHARTRHKCHKEGWKKKVYRVILLCDGALEPVEHRGRWSLPPPRRRNLQHLCCISAIFDERSEQPWKSLEEALAAVHHDKAVLLDDVPHKVNARVRLVEQTEHILAHRGGCGGTCVAIFCAETGLSKLPACSAMHYALCSPRLLVLQPTTASPITATRLHCTGLTGRRTLQSMQAATHRLRRSSYTLRKKTANSMWALSSSGRARTMSWNCVCSAAVSP